MCCRDDHVQAVGVVTAYSQCLPRTTAAYQSHRLLSLFLTHPNVPPFVLIHHLVNDNMRSLRSRAQLVRDAWRAGRHAMNTRLRVPFAPIRKGILKLCSNLGDHADSSDEASSKEVEEAVEGTLKGKQPQRNERAPDLVWGSEEWYESTKLHDNVHRMCTRNGSEPSRCIVRKVI
jgi:hypothetical protein